MVPVGQTGSAHLMLPGGSPTAMKEAASDQTDDDGAAVTDRSYVQPAEPAEQVWCEQRERDSAGNARGPVPVRHRGTQRGHDDIGRPDVERDALRRRD